VRKAGEFSASVILLAAQGLAQSLLALASERLPQAGPLNYAPMIAGHQGYVLIQTDNYNIETSVTGLVIILILAMVVLFAIEWLLRRIFRTGAFTTGCSA
jgi:hypothetical protein